MATPLIAIPYHSGSGHTKKVAESIADGVAMSGFDTHIVEVSSISDSDWDRLDAAAAIIFGAPTYMGSVSAEYKRFMDDSSKLWFEQRWKNKIAGGFTNSGGFCGDKLSSLIQINLFAMQHSMIWVGTGLKNHTKNAEPGPNDVNRLGSFLGVMTYATNDSPEVTPPAGDLETARLYGKRVVEVTKSFTQG